MSSEPTGKPSKTKKMPKPTNEKTANIGVDLEKSVMRGLDELEKEMNRAIQHRTRKAAPDSSPQATMPKLEFRAKAGNEDVARQLFDNQTVDVSTREGDELMDEKLGNVDDLEKTVMRQMQELEEALNRELLKSGSRKKRPPKRASESVACTELEKMPKLMKDEATNVNVNIEKASASQIQELERALDRNDNDPRVSCLAREIARTQDLPPNLTMSLLKFCVKVGDRDVACQLLDSQTVNVNTREGGELLWTAVEEDRDQIASMLVRRGADLNVRKFDDDRTLLHHMLRNERIGYKTEKQELFRLMLEHGADVNARDSENHSVLHDAIVSYYSLPQLVEELLKYGAQITINKEDSRVDDLSLACESDLELLPILVQVPDEETRNERAVIAIECLIMEDFTGKEKAAAMQMIGRILDLGVPVNVSTYLPDSQPGERRYSFLDKALCFKNKEAVKLLLERGADPHQKSMFGYTPLYRATTFKGYTHVSRWLIERGASIQERNDSGDYPIHGACEHESLRNLHLFLNLGADLNVTDNSGKTPFDLMRMRETLKCKEGHHLVIKHFALMIAQGGKISNRDIDRVNQCDWSRHHFEKCSEQLEKMKDVKVYGDISYFSLLSKNMYSTVQLMKNKNFLGIFKRDEKRRAQLFPDYSYMIMHSVEIAEERLEMLMAEKEQLRQGFPEAMPDHIVQKIAYSLCFEKLESWQQEYYMSFHATLKYNQADKAKIL